MASRLYVQSTSHQPSVEGYPFAVQPLFDDVHPTSQTLFPLSAENLSPEDTWLDSTSPLLPLQAHPQVTSSMPQALNQTARESPNESAHRQPSQWALPEDALAQPSVFISHHSHDHTMLDRWRVDSLHLSCGPQSLVIPSLTSTSSLLCPVDPSITHATVSPQLLHITTPRHLHEPGFIDVEQVSDQDEAPADSGDDSEYRPPLSHAVKQRGSSHRTKRTASTSPRIQTHSTGRRTGPGSRNLSSRRNPTEVASSVESYQPIRTAPRRAQREGTPNYETTNAKGDFCCEVCGYTCIPQRRLDFKRHVNTHYPHMTGGPKVCCGIPVELSSTPEWYGRIARDMPVRTFYGRSMVGGCGKVFSRTDALLRHLTSANNPCLGDIDGEWHPARQRD